MHVPYRGAAPAVSDLLGQQVQMVFLDLPVILPQIRSGTLRPIAVGSPERRPDRDGSAYHPPKPACPISKSRTGTAWWLPRERRRKFVAVLNRTAVEAMRDPRC